MRAEQHIMRSLSSLDFLKRGLEASLARRLLQNGTVLCVSMIALSALNETLMQRLTLCPIFVAFETSSLAPHRALNLFLTRFSATETLTVPFKHSAASLA